MALDSLDALPNITPDPAMITLPSTPTMTTEMVLRREIVLTPSHGTNFASLPREIRDKIYALALPHSCHRTLWISSDLSVLLRNTLGGEHRILGPYASSSNCANEACAVLLNRNRFEVEIQDLPALLGTDGINQITYTSAKYLFAIPKGPFDAKLWLRDIIVAINIRYLIHQMAEGVSLLAQCHALRRVRIDLTGTLTELKRMIEVISEAFITLVKRSGMRLTFNFYDDEYVYDTDDNYVGPDKWTGSLEALKELVSTVSLDSEDDDSETEGEDSGSEAIFV